MVDNRDQRKYTIANVEGSAVNLGDGSVVNASWGAQVEALDTLIRDIARADMPDSERQRAVAAVTAIKDQQKAGPVASAVVTAIWQSLPDLIRQLPSAVAALTALTGHR